MNCCCYVIGVKIDFFLDEVLVFKFELVILIFDEFVVDGLGIIWEL